MGSPTTAGTAAGTGTAANRTARVLVAGVGNVFLGDDGFGVEVVRRLSGRRLPDGVVVADYGIRGMHLAYDLLAAGYHTTVLVDAVSRGGTPGTLYLIEPDAEVADTTVNAHAMQPDAVLALLRQLGGAPGRVLVLGCESADLSEGIGLSPPVAAAVDGAARRVLALAERIVSDDAAVVGEESEGRVPRHSG